MIADLLRSLPLLAIVVPAFMSAKSPQMIVENSGSTNRPGLRVVFDPEGHASVEPRNGQIQHIRLPEPLCKRLLHDIEAAHPLSELPAAHCMKSVSFGSRTFVEFEGNRSPDLSCPSGDPRAQSLEKDANDILQAAREAANIPSGRVFAIPVPRRQAQ